MDDRLSNSSSIDFTSLLLGLESTQTGSHINGKANDNFEFDPLATANEEDDEQWTALHLRVRTTAEGVEAFKRATMLLSGEAGKIVFHSDGDSECSTSQRDPILVVKAYFRLLRCSVQDSPSIVDEKEWTQLTRTLLKNLGRCLKSSMQKQLQYLSETADSPEDKGNSYNRSLCTQRNNTILFYFRSTIDHVVPHVGHNTAILGSTFKIFSELAELFVALLEMESTRISYLVTSFLPVVGWTALYNVKEDVDQLDSTWKSFNDCLKQGAFCIIEAMNTGLQTVQRAVSGHQKWTSKPDGYSKIMVFMIARTISLIFLRRRRLQRSKYNPHVDIALPSPHILPWMTESDEAEISLIRNTLLLLIKVRCLSVVVRDCVDDTSKKSSLDDGRLKLFEMIVALGLRVDVYAAKLVCLAKADRSANNDNIRVGLECLVGLTSEEFNVALSLNGEEENSIKPQNVFSVGRLFVMKHILENLRSTAPDFRCGVVSSTTAVRLCETAIFEDLPKCYHFFRLRSPHDIDLQTWVGTFLSDLVGVLENVTRTLFVTEKQENYRNVMIRQHKLIVRWLAGAQNIRSKCAHLRQNHPFSNEIIMSVLHARVMLSCSSSGKSDQDRKDLISLLVKLLFDQRTETSHRRLIAAVLARLLRSSNLTFGGTCGCEPESTKAKLDTIQVMWRELKSSAVFNSICIVTADTYSLGKRRRQSSRSSTTEAYEIFWTLGILVEASISSQTVFDGPVIHHMRRLLETILTGGQSNQQLYHHGRFDHEHVFVVSLLLGSMRCHPNIESLQRMLYCQDVIKSVTPLEFIDGSLEFIDTLLSCRQRKSTMPSLYFAGVQFIGTLSAFLGIEFSESHVTRIGTILKTINCAISTLTTFEKVRLQHLAVSAVCNIGHVVPPKINMETLTLLIDIISQFLDKSDWFYVAPCLTLSEKFVKTLPSHHRRLLPAAMHLDAKLLLTSRMKGEFFCLKSRQCFDDAKLFMTPYSFPHESNFMLAYCITPSNSLYRSCFEDRIIQLREGSKLFFRHQNDGNISMRVLAPNSDTSTLSESPNAMSEPQNCSIHLIESNCKMLLRIQR